MRAVVDDLGRVLHLICRSFSSGFSPQGLYSLEVMFLILTTRINMECKKCGVYFPSTFVIEGVRRPLNRRKFCLDCSPYKCHNTRNLLKPENNKCSCCNQELTEENSYNRKNRSTKYPYCKACLSKKTKERGRRLKAECVAYKGGKCQMCGYNKYIGALDFHHRNPDEKEFEIGQRYRCCKINSTIKKELDKCDLVCSNCHRELHFNT